MLNIFVYLHINNKIILMELKEIKDFLRNKPGYLKEGGKRLRRVLEKRIYYYCRFM